METPVLQVKRQKADLDAQSTYTPDREARLDCDPVFHLFVPAFTLVKQELFMRFLPPSTFSSPVPGLPEAAAANLSWSLLHIQAKPYFFGYHLTFLIHPFFHACHKTPVLLARIRDIDISQL